MENNNQTKLFDIVIEYSDLNNENIIDFDLLRAVLSGSADFYAFILHDKDINELTGELKRPHIHIYVKTYNRTRRLTYLKLLSRNLEIDPNRITIINADNEILRIQYMIHKNNPDKYQYESDHIITNNPEYVNQILSSDVPPRLTANLLIDIVDQCNYNKIAILQAIGLGNYTRFIRVINMICRENNPDKSDFTFDND